MGEEAVVPLWLPGGEPRVSGRVAPSRSGDTNNHSDDLAVSGTVGAWRSNSHDNITTHAGTAGSFISQW